MGVEDAELHEAIVGKGGDGVHHEQQVRLGGGRERARELDVVLRAAGRVVSGSEREEGVDRRGTH